MAKRFHSGFLSDNGTEYDIEIHDSTHGGASTAFVLDARGFELSEDGETDNLHHPVMGSRLAFMMQLQESNRVLIGGFIGELVTAPEKQFQVIVYSGGTVLEWMGNVLPDISKRPDISPNNFEVVAVDGLGALAKVDYNNAGTAYTGKETLLQHALNCLNKIGTFSTFLTTETALTTVVNWWEDSLTFSSSNDPFALTRVDHAVFYEEMPGDNKKYLSCLDVLKYVVQRVNSKIYWSHGSFRIEQWGERDNVNLRERTYQKNGTVIGNTSETHDITLNQAAEARLSGGLFEWLPIVRRVEVAYKAKNWLNRIQFFSWSSVSSTAVTITGIESGSNTAARISIKINNIIANSGYTTAANVVIIYKLKVKIGNYWLKRKLNSVDNYLVSYGAVTWADTDNDYHFHVVIPYNSIPAVSSSHQVESAFLDFVTPPLPTSDDMTVKFDYFAVRQLNNGAGAQSTLAVTFSTQYPILQLWANGDPVTEFMDVTHVATDDDGDENSEVIKIETIIGDTYTTNSFSKLEVSGGLGWANSSIWRVGNSGGYADIGDLLAKEVLALRKKAVRTYIGTIRGTGLAHSRWSFDGSFWVLLNGSYDANMDEWSGKWAAIASTKTAITNPTPVPTLPPPYIPVPPGIGSDLEGLIVPPASNVISSAATGDVLTVGVISTIPTKQLLNAGAFLQGQVITLVNPSTGNTQNFTVTTDSSAGDTAIAVSGYAADEFPVGSFIVVSPQNNSVQGYGGASSGGAQSTAQVSDWWDIFQQWWDVDNTNDPNWPIEAPNVGFETDENAGDGSTAGIRFDGVGIKNFKSTSATPMAWIRNTGDFYFRSSPTAGDGAAGVLFNNTDGVALYKASPNTIVFQVKPSGIVLMNQDAHPTVEANIFYVNDGVIYLDHDGAGTKVHPQLGHIIRLQVLDYNNVWTSSFVGKGFFRFGAQYSGMEIWKITWGVGAFAGSGAGNNTFDVYFDHAGSSSVIASPSLAAGVKTGSTTLGTAQVIAADDLIFFIGSAISAVAAQGLTVEIYLRKT